MTKFTVECEMEDRWVQPFLSMLKTIEHDGAVGHSEIVGIYADGDGDFRPKFKIEGANVEKFSPPYADNYPEESIFDADWEPEDIEKTLQMMKENNSDNYFTPEDIKDLERLKEDGWEDKKMKL